MAERYANALGGNTLRGGELKFPAVAEGLSEKQREDIRYSLTGARERLTSYSDASGTLLIQDGRFKVTEYTHTASNPETYILGKPARVEYLGHRVETVNGAPGAAYSRTESLGSNLTVTLNPEGEKPEVFEFDFEAKDPVEAVARLAQTMSIDGSAPGLHEGSKMVMQIIDEAAQAVQ